VNGRICQQRLRNKEVVRNVGHTIGSWAVAVLPSTLAELPSAAVPGAASAAVPGAECNLRIVFACRAGKHRSVGLAELSRNMLASDPRVHV
jgi:hypothetical protein